jgi:hypothetical protein
MAKKPARKARPRPAIPARPKASLVRVRAIIDCAWDRDGAIRRGEAKDVHPEDAVRLLERGHVEPASPEASQARAGQALRSPEGEAAGPDKSFEARRAK